MNELVVLLRGQPKDSLSRAMFPQVQVQIGGCSQGCNKWKLVGLTRGGFLEEGKFEEESNVMRLRGIAVGEKTLRRQELQLIMCK